MKMNLVKMTSISLWAVGLVRNSPGGAGGMGTAISNSLLKRASLRRMRTPLITLFFLCGLQPGFVGSSARGGTLLVPADHPTIQAAINAAIPGDEIIVAPGTYFETINFLGKAITLRSSDGPQVTIINGSGAGSVVQCVNGEGPGTVLEGLTITGGNANEGGGMLNIGTSPTVRNCIFENNTATDRGGGMYNSFGSPSVSDTTFRQNSSGAMGGGMFNIDSASPTIDNCLFTENTSNKGGGMRNYLHADPIVTNSVFSYNHAGSEGGGMDNRKNSDAVVMNCKFIGNTADSGGGMHNYVGNATEDSEEPTIVNSLFIGNIATSGAGMRNNDPSPIITNSTFAFNEGSGISSRNGSTPKLTNCIVWGNTGGSFSGANAPEVSYSDIEGGFPGMGNLDVNPLFVNIAGPDGDYRLQLTSTLIDAGTNSAPALPAIDIDGNPRIAGGTVDMGAYEFGDPCISDGDCNDGSPCTVDACVGGLCDNQPACNDGDPCTVDSCDAGTGTCSFPPDSCDDGDACTDDICVLASGCANDPVDCGSEQMCVDGNCIPIPCDGDGICDAGEDCVSCPSDCDGKQNGSPSGRFCCGNMICESAEDNSTCAVDCGAPPFCGNDSCDPGEDPCSCAADCGAPPMNESLCTDNVDNDCDDLVDCLDPDCPACPVCGQVGEGCIFNTDCCSNKCRGPQGGKTCKG